MSNSQANRGPIGPKGVSMHKDKRKREAQRLKRLRTLNRAFPESIYGAYNTHGTFHIRPPHTVCLDFTPNGRHWDCSVGAYKFVAPSLKEGIARSKAYLLINGENQ